MIRNFRLQSLPWTVQAKLNCDEEDRDILPEICSKICETVFGAVHKAFDVMRLTEIEVSPAVLCPCSDETVAHSACHYTAIKRDYLRCSKTGASVGRATFQHMMWLCNKPASLDHQPPPKPQEPLSGLHCIVCMKACDIYSVAVGDRLLSLSLCIDESSLRDKKQGMCAPEISSELKWILCSLCAV